MKKTTVVLFVLGLLFETAGFFLSHLDEIPGVLPLISPDLATARFAVGVLEGGGSIEAGRRGFSLCAETFMKELRAQNPGNPLTSVRVLRFEPQKKLVQSFSPTKGVSTHRMLFVHLSVGGPLDWSIDALESRFDERYRATIFIASFVLFAGGVILQVLGFIHENRKSRRNPA